MDISKHQPDFIYVYIIWNDLITDPTKFVEKEKFFEEVQKNLEKQKRRDKLFIKSLELQDIPRAPYHNKFKTSVYNLYIQKSMDFKGIGIYLVENGRHTVIKDGSVNSCKDYAGVMEFITNDKYSLAYEYKV
jgi:hypothetical protein